jgi:hypothetical protein
MSRLDVVSVQESMMELKWSPIIYGEFHCVGVQVSKDYFDMEKEVRSKCILLSISEEWDGTQQPYISTNNS